MAKFFNVFTKRGITLIETLIYAAILTVTMVIIVQSMFSIIRTHRMIAIKQATESSATIGVERILREVRNATSIDLANSLFDTNPGKITLLGVDESNTPYQIVFDVQDSKLRLSKDGATAGNLTETGVLVSSLIFRKLSNSVSSGIRVEMSLIATSSGATSTIDMYGFASLRSSY